ncbi:hypothetical protein KBX17_03675 [Corynebacterium sp. CCUG 65737]|mgnify:CR=1 FL=1|uniref:hypothetical protein n=1 Tax=unclassified Corynebacterium TaxID=2624378 RepID=UPI00210923F1|nr:MULTISPECIES: hypothetical protein [unclassified Corynebacterium]MCQ4619516.1 hypothetical protein [Corynebacterium pseudogenitalium]MCQ4624394.1 hypothetical protein [Corynebacterium sp. CCUG 69979]MCQ4626917.1 hypothetical protein [Corynebacterium sp. CCUG 65737]
MNLRNIRLAMKVANHFYGQYRDLNQAEKRNVYEAVRVLANPSRGVDADDLKDIDNIDDIIDESRFSEARREAGDITRAAHARLDRRRAQFDSDQLGKRVLKNAEKTAKKNKRKKQAKGIGAATGVLALLAAIGGAVWYFFLREEPKQAPRKDHRPVKKTDEHTNSDGSVTHVYSTTTSQRTQAQGETADKIGSGNRVENEAAGAHSAHGPLSEEPAERDEELLSSIDEQLSTLDTLDDDQRNATNPRGNQ